jgi:hypothetical protein
MRIVVLTAMALLTAGCSTAVDGEAEKAPSLTAHPPSVSARPSEAAPTSVPGTAPSEGAPISAVIAWVQAGGAADPAGFHTATRDGATTQLGGDVAFVTASGTTQCMTKEKADGTLACLVKLTDPPPPAADTYGKWIGGWVDFDGSTLAVGSAHADPGRFDVGVGAELPYGSTLKFGDYQCRADQTGLICVNYAHQSGARFADSGVQAFGCLQPVDHPQVGLKFSC